MIQILLNGELIWLDTSAILLIINAAIECAVANRCADTEIEYTALRNIDELLCDLLTYEFDAAIRTRWAELDPQGADSDLS